MKRLVDKATIAFIASIDEDGYPNLKAMLPPRKHHGLKDFWFTTNTSSLRVKQFQNNQKASLYFYDRHLMYHGLMLIGEMEVLTDSETKESIWKMGDVMYYHKGVTDPDYAVLKFTAKKGRYYHMFKSESFEVAQDE
jgi:general stress protein 26